MITCKHTVSLPLSSHEDGPVDLKLSDPIETVRIDALEASIRLGDLLRGAVDLLRPTVHLYILIVHEYLPLTGRKLSTGQFGQSRNNMQGRNLQQSTHQWRNIHR